MAAIRLVDTFTESSDTQLSSHTSDSGHTWTFSNVLGAAADAKVIGNVLRVATQGSGAFYYSSLAPQSADYSVFADFTWNGVPGTAQTFTGVLGRKTANDVWTGYRVHMDTATSATKPTFYLGGSGTAGSGYALSFSSVTAGTVLGAGQLTWTPASNPSSGTVYQVELRMVGSIISMYVDGTLRASGTETTITATGRPGVEVYGEKNTNASSMDNLYVIDPALLPGGSQRAARQAVTRAATR